MTMIAAVLISGTAMAQDDQKRPERPRMDKKEMTQKRTDRMVKQYGLNSKQAKQLQTLNLNYADKMGPHAMGPRPAGGPRPPRQGGKGEQMAPQGKPQKGQMGEPTEEMKKRFAKHEETRKAYNAELKKIMTAEQYSKYEADEAKHRAMHPRRGGYGPKGKKE